MVRHVDCRKGMHAYSSTGAGGGWIARRTCAACGFVQIDLSEADTLGDTDLFTEPKMATMFKVEALLAEASEVPVTHSRSFGEAPTRRRRPATATG